MTVTKGRRRVRPRLAERAETRPEKGGGADRESEAECESDGERVVACSCSCLRTLLSVEFCVTPASLRSLVGVCEESEWSEVNVCADALRVASE